MVSFPTTLSDPLIRGSRLRCHGTFQRWISWKQCIFEI